MENFTKSQNWQKYEENKTMFKILEFLTSAYRNYTSDHYRNFTISLILSLADFFYYNTLHNDRLILIWLQVLDVGLCKFCYTFYLASIYFSKVKNGNTRIICEISSKLLTKTPMTSCFGVFIVNFEQISQIVLVFSLLTLNKKTPAGLVFDTLARVHCSGNSPPRVTINIYEK